LLQFCEQHWALDMQAAPVGEHICAVPQVPLMQA
jgi:hypothetical protein